MLPPRKSHVKHCELIKRSSTAKGRASDRISIVHKKSARNIEFQTEQFWRFVEVEIKLLLTIELRNAKEFLYESSQTSERLESCAAGPNVMVSRSIKSFYRKRKWAAAASLDLTALCTERQHSQSKEYQFFDECLDCIMN